MSLAIGFVAAFLLWLGLLSVLAGHFRLYGLSFFGRRRWLGYLGGMLLLTAGGMLVPRASGWALLLIMPTLVVALVAQLILSSLANLSLAPPSPLHPGPEDPWRVERVSIPLSPESWMAAPGALLLPYKGYGAGVVVAHGLGTDKESYLWRLFRALLARGIAILTFDLPGHGENREQTMQLPEVLECIPSAVRFFARRPEVVAGRVGVVGISLGGALSLQAAAECPQIRAVATFAAPHELRLTRKGLLREALAFFFPAFLSVFRETTAYYLLTDWFVPRPRLGRKPAELIRGINSLGIIAQIAPRPLLLVHGAWDGLIPPEQGRRLFQEARDPKELRVLKRVSHLNMLFSQEAVEGAAEWLRERLTGCPAQPGECESGPPPPHTPPEVGPTSPRPCG